MFKSAFELKCVFICLKHDIKFVCPLSLCRNAEGGGGRNVYKKKKKMHVKYRFMQ